MSKAQVKREVNSIKERLNMKQNHKQYDLSNLTEQEDKIMMGACEILNRVEVKDMKEFVNVTCTDEDHVILDAAVIIMESHRTEVKQT